MQEKARSIFYGLKNKEQEGETIDEEFTASRGWFNRFVRRNGYHNRNLLGESASADVEAASTFPDYLKKIIDDGGYLPEQIFNVDETGLFWKKMPSRTYISKEEKTASGHKAAKDWFILLLGGNSSGDYKIKPLLVYHSENPRPFKNIFKSSLPVVWMSNSSAWVKAHTFVDWFLDYYVKEMRIYCTNKQIPFKILLVIDNAAGHPQSLDDLEPNIMVVFLPSNTTSLLQPMDQGVIANFKAYYLRRTFAQAVKATSEMDMSLRDWWRQYNILDCVKNVDHAWQEVTEENMKGVWKKLLPHSAPFPGFNEDDVAQARTAVVNLGREQLGLEINEDDVEELLDSHVDELTTTELQEMERDIGRPKLQATPEEDPEVKFTTAGLKEAFDLMDKSLSIFEKMDSHVARYNKVIRSVNECVACYRVIYEKKSQRTRQASLTSYFSRTPRPVSTPNDPQPGPSREIPSPPSPASPD